MEKLDEIYVIMNNLFLSFDDVQKLSDYERKFYVKIIKKRLNNK